MVFYIIFYHRWFEIKGELSHSTIPPDGLHRLDLTLSQPHRTLGIARVQHQTVDALGREKDRERRRNRMNRGGRKASLVFYYFVSVKLGLLCCLVSAGDQ